MTLLAIAATVWILAAITAASDFQIGDSSVAAIVAAVASIMNALILWRARRAQNRMETDMTQVKDDTELRSRQIEALRSLSVERLRHINRLERIADRLESVDLTEVCQVKDEMRRQLRRLEGGKGK